ncbi:intrastrand cross-link recognition protein-like isoform X2 [Limulus polyphemus]|uniref:Intrastrand cross-link recognition protein-like isoform X2 n=1 Tax=Limulus polyphemus TaxID=6850 RepID=A0ABM1TIV0_LIMPO|nr:intrastrand cross-link recognition protein-like isoform X2 [Limulus polyphemus]
MEYDYQGMAQHQAAAMASGGNSASGIHPSMAQLSMLPTGLNLSMNAANHLVGAGLQGSPFANNSGSHHFPHSSHLMTAYPSGRSGGGKMKKKPKVNKDGMLPPKRATTAYINFTQWYREEMKKSGRQIPRIGDFGKECAAKWNSMSEEEKQPFLDAANKDRERYRKEMAIYKPARDANKPKRPGTAFMIFMKDFRKEMAGREPEGGVAALAKLGGERWRNMTEEEKRHYVEKQNEAKVEYEQVMEEYRRQQSAESQQMAKQPMMMMMMQHEEQARTDTDTKDTARSPSGNSASASPPIANSVSPAPSGSSSNMSPGLSPMSLAQMTPAHTAALQMAYGQPSVATLPNFSHLGNILNTPINYTQAHSANSSPYMGNGNNNYNQSPQSGQYSWS